MKVAITGAGGYVGSLLARYHAERGDAVHALARDAAQVPALRGVTAYGVDLAIPKRAPDAFFDGADVLYHCAAEISDERRMRPVNVDATRVLLTRARGRIAHWVQLSSLSVYGRPRKGVITEDSTLRPANTYARSKRDADGLVAELSAGAYTYTIVRPSGVIGPRMRNRSMYGLVSTVMRGRFCFIGKPGAIGNFVHESNIVDALALCAVRPEARQRIYNVAQNCPIERMIAAVAETLSQPVPRIRIPEAVARVVAHCGRFVPAFPLTPGRVDALTSRVEYPSTRIERELGFRHRQSVEDALRDLARTFLASSP